MNVHHPRKLKWQANPSLALGSSQRSEVRSQKSENPQSAIRNPQFIPALGSQLSALSTRQRGFTLVELMVVITVIAILMSLLGVVIANFVTQAREAATVATIKKVNGLLEQRLEAFDREVKRQEEILKRNPQRVDPDFQRLDREVRALIPIGVPRSSPAFQILRRKHWKKKVFSQTFDETGESPPGNHDRVTESSERLYFMLTHGQVGGAPPVDAGEFLAGEVGDTDDDGLLEFIDGWGNPLRFYRWPTRLFKPDGIAHDEAIAGLLVQGLAAHNSTGIDLLDTDPDDPLRRFGSYISRYYPDFESDFHTPRTYHVPLIVSAGPDGRLGLYEPFELDAPNDIFGTLAQPGNSRGTLANLTDDLRLPADRVEIIDALTDNITNRNQRVGD